MYNNGTSAYAIDSFEPFDAHLFFTDASGNESIITGDFVLGDYVPVRISGSLGLSSRAASVKFDKDVLEKYGLEYYAYGDFAPHNVGSNLNLSLPIFIRVGEGGWLATGDEKYWLNHDQIAREIFFIYLQSVWDSQWIPYGWYWDNGADYLSSSGIVDVLSNIETEYFPSTLVHDNLIIRIVGVSYSSEVDIGLVSEEITVYEP
jgi:hypothetical protein